MLNSLWQAVLVAALVWLALRFMRRINAATRFLIWWAVLAVVLFLPSRRGSKRCGARRGRRDLQWSTLP